MSIPSAVSSSSRARPKSSTRVEPADASMVRGVIDGWIKAIRAKDIDAVVSACAADIVTFDLDPAPILDALEFGERHTPLLRVGELDQQGRLPVGAVRDQRVVDFELLGDAVRLEDALDPQHFLDLVLHRHAVLEAESDVWPARHRAALLVRDDARPKLDPFARVTLEAEQVRGPQLLVRCT